MSKVSVSPLQGIWECWDVENTRIEIPTPIGLVRKDTEKLLYLNYSIGVIKYPLRRESEVPLSR
ncbi:hypothetical protein BU25DRAFT_254057 [Macroventuria anomochaeta]|uniref:Uncharacterized protein n=1 Tax=Macroventuria anomochaeta TaxID=301207 RepID=A0ACB6RGK2_9PLEO|nr:uncharacterized protein BU25DRAFT_254057 [Macroventuria anomochaeta]KAF2621080.1 hypothetical protein BU25DRAFT_254057 [Macroventuria anomochaeta]